MKSLLNKLIDRVKAEHDDTDSAFLPKRVHHRHTLKGFDGLSLEVSGTHYPLLNLSKGGTCIKSDDEKFSKIFVERETVHGRLHLLGHSHGVQFQLTYVQGELIGISFLSHSGFEEYLKPTLYYLDGGLSLLSLPKKQVSSYYQGPEWNSYHALNGIIEVHVASNIGGGLDEVQIIYLNRGSKDVAQFTRKAITVRSNRKGELELQEKKDILRNTCLVILGFRQIGKTHLFDQVIHAAIANLTK